MRAAAPAALALGLVSLLLVPPTSAQPGATAARWQRELATARELLIEGRWPEAEAESRRLLEELMADLKGGSEAGELIAVATVQLALAEAGLERRRDALWHVRVAEIFNPALGTTPLAADFGVAGERLDAWRAEPGLRSLGPPAATDTTLDGLHPPRIESGNFIVLRASVEQLRLLDPDLEVSFVIDEAGLPFEPVARGGLDNPAPVVLSLEVLKEFRFHPALLGDRPAAVLWKLPLPLTRGAMRKAVWELKRASIEALLREEEWQRALDEASALNDALARSSGPGLEDKRLVAAYYVSRARAGLEAEASGPPPSN